MWMLPVISCEGPHSPTHAITLGPATILMRAMNSSMSLAWCMPCRSARDTRTRAVYLDRVTRVDAASDFFGEPHVPRKAITMGVATILEVSYQECIVSLCRMRMLSPAFG